MIQRKKQTNKKKHILKLGFHIKMTISMGILVKITIVVHGNL